MDYNLYEAITNAETGGEKNPWIRTKVKPEGGSTAFGPAQITKGKVEDYVNRKDQTGLSEDSVKFATEVLLPMQELMIKYGGSDMKPGYEDYDYGGTGKFKEEDKARYKTLVDEMIKYDWERAGKDKKKFMKIWRGQDPEESYEERFNKIFDADKKTKPKQGRLDELQSEYNNE